MHDFLSNLRSSFRQEDLLDVAIVSFIVYRLLNLIKGTRAVQMLIGLGVLTAGFFSVVATRALHHALALIEFF